jgi:hypothetical protein
LNQDDKNGWIDVESRHLTPVGGNVFADLGFGPVEAAALQAESKRVIGEKLVAIAALENTPK